MPSAVPTAAPSIVSARSVDDVRPLKIVVIGAGISGILSAIKIQQRLSNYELVIYDKNEEVGGTWYENRYPGVACDIPAHCYQLSFESNPKWKSFYATGPDILEYWKRVADKYGLRKYMKLGHKSLEAKWDDKTSKWNIKMINLKTGEDFVDTADALLTALGILNDWKLPNIPGIDKYEGKLLHSAKWDNSYDYKGKNVAVIGAGSSGIQIVPSIQPEVKRLDHYVRGRTWIAPMLFGNDVAKRTGSGTNFDFTKEEVEGWLKDPKTYLAYRRYLEVELQSGQIITERGSEAQKEARALFRQLMRDRCVKKPDIADHLLPDFSPLCKRLTPGPGYLEALSEDNVDVIRTSIEKITPRGIQTVDGVHREVDAIMCATGFNTSYRNRLPVYGLNGETLTERWQDRVDSYLSVTVDGFPNYFMLAGPNSGVGTGNLLALFESISDYVSQVLEKLRTANVLTIQPSAGSVKNFTDFCDQYFAGTVYSEECSSWYKGGTGDNGRVVALWPGSSLHGIKAFKAPRWEDFEYTYVDGNEFGWIGDGWSRLDRLQDADRAYYLSTQMLHEPLEKGEAHDASKNVLGNGDMGNGSVSDKK